MTRTREKGTKSDEAAWAAGSPSVVGEAARSPPDRCWLSSRAGTFSLRRTRSDKGTQGRVNASIVPFSVPGRTHPGLSPPTAIQTVATMGWQTALQLLQHKFEVRYRVRPQVEEHFPL